MAAPCTWPRVDRVRLERDVLRASTPVLLVVAPDGCRSCRVPPAPSADPGWRGRVRCCCTADDAAPGIAAAYGVSHAPAMLLFRGGRVVRRLVGDPLPDAVETMLRAELSHRDPRP